MKKFLYENKAVLYCGDDFVVPEGWVEVKLLKSEAKKIVLNEDGYFYVKVSVVK